MQRPERSGTHPLVQTANPTDPNIRDAQTEVRNSHQRGIHKWGCGLGHQRKQGRPAIEEGDSQTKRGKEWPDRVDLGTARYEDGCDQEQVTHGRQPCPNPDLREIIGFAVV